MITVDEERMKLMKLKIEILDQNKNIKIGKNDYDESFCEMIAEGNEHVHLATQDLALTAGDMIRITVEKSNSFFVVKLDETLDSTLIYLKGTVWCYRIPLLTGNDLANSDLSFKGKAHYLSVRVAKDYEIQQYKNVAFNPHDQKEESGAYPHAFANVETRDNSTFFAKNAINGIYANLSHGSYPYQSWGINQQSDAELTIDFGRKVKIDGVGLVLRADFPHDSYWEEVTLKFSDGSSEILKTIKTSTIQEFKFKSRFVDRVTLTNLKKADDESPFPALTEFEVYGH